MQRLYVGLSASVWCLAATVECARCSDTMRVSAPGCATRSVRAHYVAYRSSRGCNAVCGALRRRELLVSVPTAGLVSQAPPAAASPDGVSTYDFTVEQYGADVGMSKYKGQVLVVVNVASE